MYRIAAIFLALLFFAVFDISAQQLSIMSFNIRYDNQSDGENSWDNRKESVLNLVKDYSPDFLGIQEGLINQVGYMDNGLNDYTYIGVGRDDGKQNGEYAAILYDSTRFNLVDQNTFWLSKTPEKVSVGWDASMERICTYGQFEHKETKQNIYVFNVHFDHIGAKARKNSAKLILSTIKELGLLDSCLIVMGDFNAQPKEKPILILNRNLDNPVTVTSGFPVGPYGTYNGFNQEIIPTSRIDYIFSRNLITKIYDHVNIKRNNGLCISDHLPVYAVYRIED